MKLFYSLLLLMFFTGCSTKNVFNDPKKIVDAVDTTTKLVGAVGVVGGVALSLFTDDNKSATEIIEKEVLGFFDGASIALTLSTSVGGVFIFGSALYPDGTMSFVDKSPSILAMTRANYFDFKLFGRQNSVLGWDTLASTMDVTANKQSFGDSTEFDADIGTQVNGSGAYYIARLVVKIGDDMTSTNKPNQSHFFKVGLGSGIAFGEIIGDTYLTENSSNTACQTAVTNYKNTQNSIYLTDIKNNCEYVNYKSNWYEPKIAFNLFLEYRLNYFYMNYMTTNITAIGDISKESNYDIQLFNASFNVGGIYTF